MAIEQINNKILRRSLSNGVYDLLAIELKDYMTNIVKAIFQQRTSVARFEEYISVLILLLWNVYYTKSFFSSFRKGVLFWCLLRQLS